MTAHQRVGEIQLRPCQQVEARRVDEDLGVRLLDYQVIRLNVLVQLESVLKSTAPSGKDGHAQSQRIALGGGDFGDAGGGPLGYVKLSHGDYISLPATELKSYRAGPLIG